jgi:hypothetical protein
MSYWYCKHWIVQHTMANVIVPKMVQLLSYIRHHKRPILPTNTTEAAAAYISYAIAELLGPYITANRRCSKERSHAIIIESVIYALNTEGIEKPAIENWFDPAIGVGANPEEMKALTAATMTIGQAKVILEIMSTNMDTSTYWLNGISMTACAITSIAKRGTISKKAIDKITKGIKSDFGIPEVRLPERVIQRFYTNFGSWVTVTSVSAAALFDRLSTSVPESAIRLTTVINQAAKGGLTTYYTIREAMVAHRAFPWVQAYKRFTNDFVKFSAAVTLVGNNQYYGFNRNVGDAASANFKSLGYLALQLKIQIDHDENLVRYKGGVK